MEGHPVHSVDSFSSLTSTQTLSYSSTASSTRHCIRNLKNSVFYAIKSQKYLIKEMELSDLAWCYFPNFLKKSEGHFSIDLVFCDDSIW